MIPDARSAFVRTGSTGGLQVAENGRDQFRDGRMDRHRPLQHRIGCTAFMMSRTPWIASSPPTPRIAAPTIRFVSASATTL